MSLSSSRAGCQSRSSVSSSMHLKMSFVPLDIKTIIYSDETDSITPSLTTGLNQAFKETAIKNQKIGQKVIHIMKQEATGILDFFEPLFWYTHIMLNQTDKNQADDFLKEAGVLYASLVFPIQTKISDPDVANEILRVMPFFASQTFLFAFINMTYGHSSTVSMDFRYEITSFLLRIFSPVDVGRQFTIKSLLEIFPRPPHIDLPDVINVEQPAPKKHDEILLPKEDLSTLIDMERRMPPSFGSWNTSQTSPLLLAGVGYGSVPGEPIRRILIQTTESPALPPLIPTELSDDQFTRDNYNPSNEPRSLLLRSQRTDLAQEAIQLKRSSNEKRDSMDQRAKQQRRYRAKMKKAVLYGTKQQHDQFVDLTKTMEQNGHWDITKNMIETFPGMGNPIKHETHVIEEEKPKAVEKTTEKVEKPIPRVREYNSIFADTEMFRGLVGI